MKKQILKGLGTALATPFHKNGQIDFQSLDQLVEYNIENNVDFVLAMGTTAETPTLTEKERVALLSTITEICKNRIPVILGIGGNDTRSVLAQLDSYDLSSVSHILSVAPYYNRPSQEGLFLHYQMIAENASVPVLAYNVPYRTGVNMSVQTIMRLAKEVPNLVGIKEASGDMNQIMKIMTQKPADFMFFSGDDALAFSVMGLGGQGLISTSANVFPKELSEMIHACQKGEWEKARKIHFELLPKIEFLFEEGSPAGLKAALEIKGLGKNVVRLPLTKVSKMLYKRIEEVL